MGESSASVGEVVAWVPAVLHPIPLPTVLGVVVVEGLLLQGHSTVGRTAAVRRAVAGLEACLRVQDTHAALWAVVQNAGLTGFLTVVGQHGLRENWNRMQNIVVPEVVDLDMQT